MNRETLLLNHPDEFNFYSNEIKEGRRMEAATEGIEEDKFRLEIFLARNFGCAEEGMSIEKFKIEHLDSLSADKKKKFEHLVRRIIGISACWDYFSEQE